MGGLRLPPSADAILSAINSYVDGQSLEFNELLHKLAQSASKPADVASILTGLTHVTSRVHKHTDEAAALRCLVDTVLNLNVVALAASTSSTPSKTSSSQDTMVDVSVGSGFEFATTAHVDAGNEQSPSLAAFAAFAVNLISVDASYVESLLYNVVPPIFLAPLDAPGAAAASAVAHRIITVALKMYARAAPLLCDALRRRYPHPVHPAAEHAAYAHAVLQIARTARRPSLVRGLVNAVIERLAAIEALTANVPSFEENTDLDKITRSLTPDMQKLQAVLVELVSYIRLAHAEDPGNFANTHLDVVFSAHEALVVPVTNTRASPYVLLIALSLAGGKATVTAVERLRQSFHDPSVPDRLRARFLEHSATIVVRARSLQARDALRWMSRIAAWLNTYVDALDYEGDTAYIDTDLHFLFYSACAVLMATLSRRRDVLKGLAASETIARLRLYRIMSCPINPLLVVPQSTVEEFIRVVKESANLDLGQILIDNKNKMGPTRTKFGSLNYFTYAFSCPDLELPLFREQVDAYVRWDCPVKTPDAKQACASETPEKRVRFDDIDVVAPSSSFVATLTA